MNDVELDEILESWNTPPVSSTLRPRTLSRFAPGEKSHLGRKLLIALAVAAALLLAVPAIPQVFFPGAQPLYTVDSVFIRYLPDGTHNAQTFIRSYNDSRREIVISERLPGDPLRTTLRQAVDAVGLYLLRFSRAIGRSYEPSTRDCAGEGVLDDTILGYSTVKRLAFVQNRRITTWVAPDLGCFALRLRMEEQQPDGSFRLTWTRESFKVNLSP